MLLARRLPRGSWRWRSVVLGILNVAAFFLLAYVAAQLLPTSVASSIMALAPLALVGAGWAVLGQRPRPMLLLGAAVGIAGIVLVVGWSTQALDPRGVAASAGALLMSSFGAVLARRWSAPHTSVLASTAWQLLAGGLLLAVVALIREGAPPPLDGRELAGFAFVSLIATALAFACWFGGLAHLPAGVVGLIGLLNPITGVLLGALAAKEALVAHQLAGIALVFAGLLTTTFRRRRGLPPSRVSIP